jgi:hypothetical protein
LGRFLGPTLAEDWPKPGNFKKHFLKINVGPLGFNRVLIGFNRVLIGFNRFLIGFNRVLIGFNMVLIGFNRFLTGFNRVLIGLAWPSPLRSCPSLLDSAGFIDYAVPPEFDRRPRGCTLATSMAPNLIRAPIGALKGPIGDPQKTQKSTKKSTNHHPQPPQRCEAPRERATPNSKKSCF